MWQDSPPTMSQMRKSRPYHGCLNTIIPTPQRHGDTKSAPSKSVQGSPPSRQVDQGFPKAHACFNWWCQNQVLNFQVSERTPTCSRGFSVFLEKEGIGVALLLKGVTKAPSCMRNVLGDLMTPAVLFVALEIKKIRLQYLLKMYDFKIQNVQLVCPQTNSMISRSTWGELNIVLNARRIELGTKLIFSHAWAKVMRRVQQRHSFHDSTCAIEPTGTPPTPKFKKVPGNVQWPRSHVKFFHPMPPFSRHLLRNFHHDFKSKSRPFFVGFS